MTRPLAEVVRQLRDNEKATRGINGFGSNTPAYAYRTSADIIEQWMREWAAQFSEWENGSEERWANLFGDLERDVLGMEGSDAL